MKLRRAIGLLVTAALIAGVGSVARADTVSQPATYPDAPADLTITGSAQSSLTASWTAVVDATGYRVGLNGVALRDTPQTTYTWTGLSCGTTYRLSVQSEQSTHDTSGGVALASGATAACDTATAAASSPQALGAPTNLQIAGSQQTSLTASWGAVVGATGYRVGLNGVALRDTPQTTYTWMGLACGTTYRLSVQSEQSTQDTSGGVAVVSGTTVACGTATTGSGSGSAQQTVSTPQTPSTAQGQTFGVTSSISNGSTLTGSLTWTAATHGPPVNKVEFLIDGTLQWTEHFPPYQFNGDPGGMLDTTKLSNGTHALAVIAYAAGGQTATAQVSVTVANQKVTTPSLPASGSVTFNGSFDGGNISPWQSTPLGGAQCVNFGVASNSSIVRGGVYLDDSNEPPGHLSARFDLPAAGTATACELLRGRTIAMDDEWYAIEVRFPANWQEPSSADWGLSLAQLNFENIWGSPISLIAHSNYVDLVLNSGLCASYKSANPSCQYSTGMAGNLPRQHILPSAAFSTGVWHQFLIHVKWTNGNDGIVQGFHRLRGETAWTPTTSLSGYPTVQHTSTFTPTAADRTVDKIGAYRGAANFPLSVWEDDFCQATTMAAAQTCF